ncbi:hypothetical protein Q1695_004271 [Nippostrongylus brasiliensis]|nr:hypothetical protein Q1695_004271 [Nippostrongylus brasiliensis]
MRGCSVGVLVVIALDSLLLVDCLRCYRGSGNNYHSVTTNVNRMCSYEPKFPCDFKGEPEYKVHELNEEYTKHCLFLEPAKRVICSCIEDLCNGNFQKLLDKWHATDVNDTNIKQCVDDHLVAATNLVDPGDNPANQQGGAGPGPGGDGADVSNNPGGSGGNGTSGAHANKNADDAKSDTSRASASKSGEYDNDL